MYAIPALPSTGTGALLLGGTGYLNGWNTYLIIGCLALSLVSIVLLVMTERRAKRDQS